MNSHYQAIYNAAIKKDASSLKKVLEDVSIDMVGIVNMPEQKLESITLTPISLLAIENNQNAVNFLLNQGAHLDGAVHGYAIGGHFTQVETLLNQGASTAAAILGFAIGGYSAQVEALLAEDPDINPAVYGYAIGGHSKQVEMLLDRGASKETAITGYAIRGHSKQVEMLLDRGGSKEAAISGYALGGHSKQVKMLLDRGGSKTAAILGYAAGGHKNAVQDLLTNDFHQVYVNEAVIGYAMGGHNTHVNELRNCSKITPPLIRCGKCEKCQWQANCAVLGYAIRGDITNVQTLLTEGATQRQAARGYARGGHTDQADPLLDEIYKVALFKKIKNLEDYGKSLQDQGYPVKGQKAIRLAKQIRTEAYNYLLEGQDKKTTEENMSKIIANGKNSMGEDRNARDIIAHILFAFTGIGLLIILGKKYLTASKSGFLNATRRQELTDNIEKETRKILEPEEERLFMQCCMFAC